MLSFDFKSASRPTSEIVCDALTLRPAEPRDADAWLRLRATSRAHLVRWEPAWKPSDATPEAFRARVRAHERERRAGVALPLLMFRRDDDRLVGGVTLANIRYQAACSGQIGYWVGAPFVRRGYALAAVRAVMRHAFERLGLNRIEAASQPDNVASCRLLERAGFVAEGYARDYLYINGAWRDHRLFAAIAADFGAARFRARPPSTPGRADVKRPKRAANAQ